MALFDKPFRYVPQVDAGESVSGENVAVVDSVAPVDGMAAASAAGDGSPTTVNVPAAPAVEGSIAPESTTPIDLPMADPPKVMVEPPVVDRPKVLIDPPVVGAIIEPLKRSAETPVPAPSTTLTADPVIVAAANQPAVELVARGERSLRQASDGGELTVFSRVVPSAPNRQSPGDTERLVSAIDEAEPVLDQLRSLAASLHQARSSRELKVIAVTSSVSGEGKTLLAANLALTLSRSYMRQVLLIDADLRRPSLHRLFGIPSQEGIRTALDSVREGTPVAVQEVGPRLALLPAGKPVRDPISVLASDAMHRLMTGATHTFDWIILDTPPVGMLPDVSLLSSLSDAVLLVVEAGGVRYDLVQRTVESIGAERIFGVVLNKVPEREIVSAYGMHYYAPYR